VKPEIEAAPRRDPKLLGDNADLKVLIVGHTDNVGKFDYNINSRSAAPRRSSRR